MVREAAHKETGHRVALKIYDKSKLNSTPSTLKCVKREISLLGQISQHKNDNEETGHPCVMKIYDVTDNSRSLYLVMEKCKGKMLHTAVKDYSGMGSIRKNLPENMCAKIFYQIIRGM